MIPDTSLVIINKSDPRVAATLEALTALESVRTGSSEIIVVDASAGSLADLRPRFQGVRWVDFTPIPGLTTIPHQRNTGLAAAQGQIVVFIDAACIPRENWLDVLLDPIRTGEERIVAGASRSPGANSLRDEDVDRLANFPYLSEAPTINLAIHREVFDAIGGFDERFAYGSDVDFTWRSVDAGFRIRNEPTAVVEHDWGGGGEEFDRSWRYGRARTRLYLKHPHRWRDLFSDDAPLIAYPAYLLILPLTLRRPWIHLSLALPAWRNRGRRPVASIVDHFIRGAAAYVEVASQLSHWLSRSGE